LDDIPFPHIGFTNMESKNKNICFTVTLNDEASDLLKQALRVNMSDHSQAAGRFEDLLGLQLEKDIQKAASQTVITAITTSCEDITGSTDFFSIETVKAAYDLLCYAHQLELTRKYNSANERLKSLQRYLDHLEKNRPGDANIKLVQHERSRILGSIQYYFTKLKENEERIPEGFPHVSLPPLQEGMEE
jgi:hypothetical protein